MKVLFFIPAIFSCLIVLGQDDIIDNTSYNAAVEAYNEATTEYELENFEASLEGFQNAYALNPNNSDYSFGIASSYYELKNYDSAKAYIKEAIALEPKQPDYHYRAGNIYYHTREYFESFRNYTIAMNNQGRNDIFIDLSNCQFNRGVSALYSRLYEEAIKDFTAVISEENINVNALHMRGVAYYHLDRMDDACKDFTDANGLGHPNSKRYLDKYCE